MFRRIISCLFSLFIACSLFAQTILVHPYLQDAEPNSIKILWETDGGSSHSVSWGTSNSNLDQSVNAGSETTSGTNMLHTTKLVGLSANTRYYYQVTSDAISSSISEFITPPLKSSEQSFNLIAMSDMQKDNSFPLKFQEVVQDGVLDYFETRYGEDDIAEHLGFVLVPGDLVQNGNNYAQWQNDFFGQAEPLFSKVPVYPVLGNHEANSNYYFQYFSLPENGSTGYLEHWYYKDYSNVRIIGLNSNSGFRLQEQLDWLEQTLDEACQDDDIDFVFAQLHHPYKSELWTPGELDYTGDVISLLENFSSDCGKPSIHFFGHTHGYSRGQSRDHNHLWVNAATAGGAIDNWGEFPNADYEEFSVSIDEYGFVLLEVQAGNDPQFVLKRISRGDQSTTIDNEEQDQITIKKNATAPQQPSGIFPSAEEVSPDCFILQADAFNDPNDQHQASHWQISTDCGDFSAPVFESWRQHENWYNEINTQVDDDLTNEEVNGLNENSNYCWRVRYRDQYLEWSDWSSPVSFETGTSGLTDNLLLNAGAEDGVNDWTVETGVIESLTDGECNGEAPYSGTYYFAVGGLCDGNETDFSEVFQTIDVENYADKIDQGISEAFFGGYLSNYSGSDEPSMKLDFLDASSNVIASSIELSTTSDPWVLLNSNELIPPLTRSIKVVLTGTRNAGSDNDSYFDDLFVQIDTVENIDCAEGPLPVEVFSFDVKCESDVVTLAWQVFNELDINTYQIERSSDGLTWNNIGALVPSASIQSVKYYEYRDFDQSENLQNYYRIKIVENDGTFYFTKIVSNDCFQEKISIKLFPNPGFNDILYLNIETPANYPIEIRITDLLGRPVYYDQQSIHSGRNLLEILTDSWPTGYYNINVNTAHWQWAGKAIKQR